MADGRLHLSFNAFYDLDADVWVARSDEGRITTEAPARDALLERLKAIVPDALESRLGRAPRDVAITVNWQELRTFEQTETQTASRNDPGGICSRIPSAHHDAARLGAAPARPRRSRSRFAVGD